MITKEHLEDFYWKKEWTLREIANIFDMSIWQIFSRMKKYGIKCRNSSEAHKLLWRHPKNRKRLIKNLEKARQNTPAPMKGKHQSLNAKAKISLANKKKWRNPDYRNNKIASLLGKNNPFYGKTHTETNKKKMSESQKEYWKHHIVWNKGKTFSEKSRRKMSKTRQTLFEKKILIPWNKGIPCSEKTKQKISNANKNMVPWWTKNGLPQNPFIGILPTKAEKQLIKIISDYSLPFRYTGNFDFWIENINPDFVASDRKIAIEIFGEYWHDPNINPAVKFNRTVKGRTEIFKRNGWKVIIFWSREIVKKNENLILERLQNVLA